MRSARFPLLAVLTLLALIVAACGEGVEVDPDEGEDVGAAASEAATDGGERESGAGGPGQIVIGWTPPDITGVSRPRRTSSSRPPNRPTQPDSTSA